MTQKFHSAAAHAFESTIQALAPGARGAELRALFDGRANRFRISEWRRGYRPPPAWAIDLLRAKIRRRHDLELAAAFQMETGPGRKAGARNLAEYLARRR